MLINLLVITIITAAAWASLFPEQALDIIGELKRQLRQRVIRRTGENGAKELEYRLHRYARQRGIDQEIVEEVLAEHHALIVERLGETYADEILGEAHPTRHDP